MSRDEGFTVADIATAKLTDPKFKTLWRNLRDESQMNAAVMLHDAILLASWQHGERVNADDAAPFWMADATEAAQHLVDAELLDDTRCIPEHAFHAWIGPAIERRDALRERWRKANEQRRKASSPRSRKPDRAVTSRSPRGNSAVTSRSPRGVSGGTASSDRIGTATPVRPSVRPSDESVRHARAREGEGAVAHGLNGSEPMSPDRAQAVLDDPDSNDAAKAGARAYLDLRRQFGRNDGPETDDEPRRASELFAE